MRRSSRPYPVTPVVAASTVIQESDDDDDEGDDSNNNTRSSNTTTATMHIPSLPLLPMEGHTLNIDNHHNRQNDDINNNAAASSSSLQLVRNIASFLSFSDAVSLTSFTTTSVGVGNPHINNNSNSRINVGSMTLGGFSGGGGGGTAAECTDVDNSSWVVGEGDGEGDAESTDWSWFGTYGQQTIATPLTPALVAVSPGATPNDMIHRHSQQYDYQNFVEEENDGDEYVVMVNNSTSGRSSNIDSDHDHHHRRFIQSSQRIMSSYTDFHRMEELLHERRRKWAQEKIITAVFSHPQSLRSFCWEAYIAAKEIQLEKQIAQAAIAAAEADTTTNDDLDEIPPETQVEPLGGTIMSIHRKRKRPPRMDLRRMVIHEMIDWIFRSVPVSVVLDVLEAAGMTMIDTTGASFKITITTIQHTISALVHLICTVWETVTHCVTNPFQVLEAIVSLQFNAMGKTSEVLASGIQSVATGVGSASNMALYRLSATANMTSSSTASLAGHFQRISKSATGQSIPAGDSKGGVFNKRLLQKLSAINNAALVVNYQESEDDTCGLTRHAVSRTRRMMHYSVSLRPFVATVKLRPDPDQNGAHSEYDHGLDSPFGSVNDLQRTDSFSDSSSQEDGQHSPFMCTPQSFPPTPHSRQMVIAQRSQLSDDVVFLARDRLRVHDGLGSENIRTRERSQALEDGKRLAIFACDKDSGIELTCGKHIATKGGDMYYASARSMVAVLRNCFVYYEFTILPRFGSPIMATLAIGLSTEEMPPNTLVGAWQSSVGLCTTGQILMAGQWCSPADPAKFAYGTGSTVGCLVCMDDDKAYETWDGIMIKASIRLNVNGVMVSPPVSTLPMSGAPGSLPMTSSSAFPVGGSGGRTNTSATVGASEKGLLSPSSLPGRLELPATTLTLLVPSAEDLYPTVTLQSPATSVVCRFSSEDVMATTREMIGAPPGAAVYAIDGSVILNDYEDVSS